MASRNDGQAAVGNEDKGDSAEKLFESFPHATLALMAVGCGFIALGTLFVEMYTAQLHASVIGFPAHFLSVPMGVATMILAGLVARVQLRFAVPALVFGGAYWLTYLGWFVA